MEKFVKLNFVGRQKDFCTPFHVIILYTKQSTSSAADNSEMAMIGLSLKCHQLRVCSLIDDGSKPVKRRFKS